MIQFLGTSSTPLWLPDYRRSNHFVAKTLLGPSELDSDTQLCKLTFLLQKDFSFVMLFWSQYLFQSKLINSWHIYPQDNRTALFWAVDGMHVGIARHLISSMQQEKAHHGPYTFGKVRLSLHIRHGQGLHVLSFCDDSNLIKLLMIFSWYEWISLTTSKQHFRPTYYMTLIYLSRWRSFQHRPWVCIPAFIVRFYTLYFVSLLSKAQLSFASSRFLWKVERMTKCKKLTTYPRHSYELLMPVPQFNMHTPQVYNSRLLSVPFTYYVTLLWSSETNLRFVACIFNQHTALYILLNRHTGTVPCRRVELWGDRLSASGCKRWYRMEKTGARTSLNTQFAWVQRIYVVCKRWLVGVYLKLCIC